MIVYNVAISFAVYTYKSTVLLQSLLHMTILYALRAYDIMSTSLGMRYSK